jgi:multidrug efflux pump subunit AcrA (membrane-fusion protein)
VIKRLLLISLVVVGFVGCGKAPVAAEDPHGHEEESAQHAEESVTLSKDQEAIAGIEVEAARMQMMQASFDVPGTIASTSSGRAVVTPPVAGRLIRLTVQLGEEVKKGQVIGVIESTELAEAWAQIGSAEQMRDSAAAHVKEAKSQAQLAAAKLQSAEQTLQRQRDFVKAGAFNTATLQQAQRELNDAQNDLLSAQKELATHTENLRRLENLFKEGLVSKFDLQEAQLDVQKDEIEVSRAEAAVRSAKTTYDREKNIADKGLVNSREVQTAEAEVRSARLEQDRAKIAVRSAEAALSSSNKAVVNARTTYRTYSGGASASSGRVNLVAPIAGTVSHLDVTQGQAVDRTQALCEVENLNSVWVTANVPEREAAKIKKGMDVSVKVAAFPDFDFEGVVQVVGSRIDAKTRSIPVQCLVVNVRMRLKPEMFANVQIAYGASEEVLSVPSSAVVKDGNETVVFVREGEGFVRHEVTLGRQSGKRTEIQSGLEAGQIVASEGGFILKSQLAKDELKGHDH